MLDLKTALAATAAAFLVACGGGGGGSSSQDTPVADQSQAESSEQTETPTETQVDTQTVASCSGNVIDIGGSGNTFNYVGKFKEVDTYRKCSNLTNEICQTISYENGVLTSKAFIKYDIDEDTCEKTEINANVTFASTLTKNPINIQTDSEGRRYIEEQTTCDDIDGAATIISSIPDSVKNSAIATFTSDSDMASYIEYTVEENGKYYNYEKQLAKVK